MPTLPGENATTCSSAFFMAEAGNSASAADRHRAVMLGAVDGIFQRPVLGHQPDGMVEVAVDDLAALQRPEP